MSQEAQTGEDENVDLGVASFGGKAEESGGAEGSLRLKEPKDFRDSGQEENPQFLSENGICARLVTREEETKAGPVSSASREERGWFGRTNPGPRPGASRTVQFAAKDVVTRSNAGGGGEDVGSLKEEEL